MKYKPTLPAFILAGLLLSLVLVQACSSRTVTMHTLRPAEITFPAYVKTVLLVDRTEVDKKALNIIEGLLTGEMPGEDKAGVQEAMNAMQQAMMTSDRFVIKRATETLKGNSLTAAFPAALDWNNVKELCAKYQADAIVCIEIFDTDFIITNGKRKTKKTITENGVKKEIEVDEFYAEGVANAKVGFRLYDPKAMSIVDQQLFNHTNTWTSTGKSIQDALIHLVAKSEATRYVSNLAGTNYGYKLVPRPIYIHREYYVKAKKTPQVKQGARYAEVNNWEGAINVWKNGERRALTEKGAGRICYNIAVGYEVLGRMDSAQYWAQRAYIEYGNKRAREYTYSLEVRNRNNRILEQQLNPEGE